MVANCSALASGMITGDRATRDGGTAGSWGEGWVTVRSGMGGGQSDEGVAVVELNGKSGRKDTSIVEVESSEGGGVVGFSSGSGSTFGVR